VIHPCPNHLMLISEQFHKPCTRPGLSVINKCILWPTQGTKLHCQYFKWTFKIYMTCYNGSMISGSVTTTWRVLRLRMGKRLPIWMAAANISNKQSRTSDKGWSSSFGVGRGTNNPSPQKKLA